MRSWISYRVGPWLITMPCATFVLGSLVLAAIAAGLLILASLPQFLGWLGSFLLKATLLTFLFFGIAVGLGAISLLFKR